MFQTLRLKTVALLAMLLTASTAIHAQIGEHRNDLAIGFNAGYIMSSVGFTPKVTQDTHTGITAGLSMRYTCEKYFKTICSISAEVNYARIGWKERILTANDEPVINQTTGMAEAYQRDMNYIQVPIFAHLAWGRERKGVQFFSSVRLHDKRVDNHQLQCQGCQLYRSRQQNMRTGHHGSRKQVRLWHCCRIGY